MCAALVAHMASGEQVILALHVAGSCQGSKPGPPSLRPARDCEQQRVEGRHDGCQDEDLAAYSPSGRRASTTLTLLHKIHSPSPCLRFTARTATGIYTSTQKQKEFNGATERKEFRKENYFLVRCLLYIFEYSLRSGIPPRGRR